MSEFVNARLGGYRAVFSLLRCVCLTILGWCLGRVMVGVGGLRISAHDLTVSTKFDDGIVQKISCMFSCFFGSIQPANSRKYDVTLSLSFATHSLHYLVCIWFVSASGIDPPRPLSHRLTQNVSICSYNSSHSHSSPSAIKS